MENLIPRFGLPSTSRSIKRRGPVFMSSINTYDLFDVRRRNDFFERETLYSFITRMATWRLYANFFSAKISFFSKCWPFLSLDGEHEKLLISSLDVTTFSRNEIKKRNFKQTISVNSRIKARVIVWFKYKNGAWCEKRKKKFKNLEKKWWRCRQQGENILINNSFSHLQRRKKK